MWFIEDGTCPHLASDMFALLAEHYKHCVIPLGYWNDTEIGINWPST